MKSTFKSYRDLDVWKKAMDLAREVYKVTAKFPTEERFGLTNQIRRAAVSVPSNLAEGHARATAADFSRFISISMGSVAELETQLLLSADLGYLGNNDLERLLSDLDIAGKMLRGLSKAIARRKLQQRN
jgi:four helix bundle protein